MAISQDKSFCFPSLDLLRSWCLVQALGHQRVSKMFSLSTLCIPSPRGGRREECEGKVCMLLKELHKSPSIAPLLPFGSHLIVFLLLTRCLGSSSPHALPPNTSPSHCTVVFPVCSEVWGEPRTCPFLVHFTFSSSVLS